MLHLQNVSGVFCKPKLVLLHVTSNCAFHIAAPRVIVANGLNLLAGAGTVESRLMLQMPETFIVIIRQLLNSNTVGK